MLGFEVSARCEGRRREAGRKVVLVTGASSGIGRAIALGCARDGADLAITYRSNRSGAEETAGAIRARRAASRCPAGRHQPGRGRRARWPRTVQRALRAGRRLDQQRRRRHPHRRAAADCRRVEKLDLRARGGPARDDLASWAAVGADAASGAARSSTCPGITWSTAWRARTRSSIRRPRAAIASFSRSLAREVAPRDPGEHPGAGLHRDRLRRAGRPATGAGRSSSANAARPLGHARGRRRRGGVPGVGRVAFLTGQMIMVNGGVVM